MSKKTKLWFITSKNKLTLGLVFIVLIGVAISYSSVSAFFIRLSDSYGYGYDISGSNYNDSDGTWGYGVGYGYGTGYGPNQNKVPYNYRVTGDDLSSYGYGKGYGYRVYPYGINEGNIVVGDWKIDSLYKADVITTPNGYSLESSPSITFNLGTKLILSELDPGIAMSFYADTTISCSSAQGVYDYSNLSFRSNVSTYGLDDIYDKVETLRIQLANCNDEINNYYPKADIPVQVSLRIYYGHRGEAMDVYRKLSSATTWDKYKTCVINDHGRCEFLTQDLYDFAIGYNDIDSEALAKEECAVVNTAGTTDLYILYDGYYRRFGSNDSNALYLQYFSSFDNVITLDGSFSISPLGDIITGYLVDIAKKCGGIVVDACVDTDGGKNLFVKGQTYNDASQSWTADSCDADSRLVEHWCGSAANGDSEGDYNKVQASVFDCAKGCVNGACVGEESLPDLIVSDITIYNNKLRVYYENNSSVTMGLLSRNTMYVNLDIYENGFQKILLSTSRIMDGRREGFMPGEKSYIEFDNYYPDKRFYAIATVDSTNIINEASEINNTLKKVITPTVNTNDVCIDSDDGKDLFVKGFIYLYGSQSWNTQDYCYANNVVEQWCGSAVNGDSKGEYNKVQAKIFDCANGCVDGACVAESQFDNCDSITTTSSGYWGDGWWYGQGAKLKYSAFNDPNQDCDFYCKSGYEWKNGACVAPLDNKCYLVNLKNSSDYYLYMNNEYRKFANNKIRSQYGFGIADIVSDESALHPLGEDIVGIEAYIKNQCLGYSVSNIPDLIVTDVLIADNGKMRVYYKNNSNYTIPRASRNKIYVFLGIYNNSYTQEHVNTTELKDNNTADFMPGEISYIEFGTYYPDITFHARAIVDWGNNIDETNEINNRLYKFITPSVQDEETCVDSDNGKDYYTKGRVTLSDGSVIGDSCNRDDMGSAGDPNDQRLTELICDSTKDVGFAYDTSFVCPNGCQNGVCLPKVEVQPKIEGFGCVQPLSEVSYLSGFDDYDTLMSITRKNPAKLSKLVSQVVDKFGGDEFVLPNTYTPLIGQCTWMEHLDTGNCYIYSYKEGKKVSVYTDQSCNDKGSGEAKMIKAIQAGYCCSDPVSCTGLLKDNKALSYFGKSDTLESIKDNDYNLGRLVDQVIDEFGGGEFNLPNTYTPLIGQCTWMEHWDTKSCYVYSYQKGRKISAYTDQGCDDKSSGRAKMIKAIRDGNCCSFDSSNSSDNNDDDNSSKDTNKDTSSTCFDSDDMNIYVKSKNWGVDNNQNEFVNYDSCKDSKAVKEYWCATDGSNSNKMVSNFTYYDCPNGCQAGACLAQDNNQADNNQSSNDQNDNQVDDNQTDNNQNNDNQIQNDGDINRTILRLKRQISALEEKVVKLARKLEKKMNPALTDRFKGTMIIRPDQDGQVWWVDKNGSKFFMKDGEATYRILSNFGQGITEDDLKGIPLGFKPEIFGDLLDSDGDGLPDVFEQAIGSDPNNTDSDGDGYDDYTELKLGWRLDGQGKYEPNQKLINKIGNNILLQVAGPNARGQAWVILDGYRYYASPQNAYDVMSYLSHGVDNNNFSELGVVGEVEE